MEFGNGEFKACFDTESGWYQMDSARGTMRFRPWPHCRAVRELRCSEGVAGVDVPVVPRLQLDPGADWNGVIRLPRRSVSPVRWFEASRTDTPEAFEDEDESFIPMDPKSIDVPYGASQLEAGTIVDWYCRLTVRRSRDAILEFVETIPIQLRVFLGRFQPQYQFLLLESGIVPEGCPAEQFLEATGGYREYPAWILDRIAPSNCCPTLFRLLRQLPTSSLKGLAELPWIGVAAALVARVAARSGKTVPPELLEELRQHEEWSANRNTLAGTIPLTVEVAEIVRQVAGKRIPL